MSVLFAMDATDPFSIFPDTGGRLLLLAALVSVAVLVFFAGRRMVAKDRSALGLRAQGRGFRSSARARDRAWVEAVARLEASPPTPIALAQGGPVRFVGVLTAASGSLGGPPARACVWRNRAGARAESAVAAEVLVLADETGRVGIENAESAHVIAPSDSHGIHHENVSLYLGDRIEVLGMFAPEKTGEHDDPKELVYGTLGARGSVEIRLVERPRVHAEPAPEPS